MNELQKSLDEYLAIRRKLGFKLEEAGKLLHDFVFFTEKEGVSFITAELALRWATQSTGQTARSAKLLGIVRGFAQYQSVMDPRTEVPSQELLPYRYHRRSPYIYSTDEVERLITAAQQLQSPLGWRAVTYSTVFGLLAATGMRVSEPTSLNRKDVDLINGILLVYLTKFGKSRFVPIHPSTQKALREYDSLRGKIFPKPKTDSFFISEQGTRLTNWTVRNTFVKLSRQIGLRGPHDSHGPRLLDFRHSFATRTLLAWYRNGMNVNQHMPELSTYLGHAHVTDTYWYISAVPELMQLAAMRLEQI
ncbi:MAG: tyrosine-type recombinase/integrase [Desulfobulbaceae bacterium]|jgi:integrase/recombinase XerD|nr:tyrosine-type recombinase/integrase [Desulfobulbaceae bacterium]